MNWIVCKHFLGLDVIVDIRPHHQYVESHIPRAVSLPFPIDLKRFKKDFGPKGIGLQPAQLMPYLNDYATFRNALDTLKGTMGVYDENGGWRSQILHNIIPYSPDPVQLRCVPGGQRALSGKLGRLPFLKGGFKAYKIEFHTIFDKPLPLVKLSGATGSGKTQILHELGNMGVQILDLEKISGHSGSVFGGLFHGEQPDQWEFEHRLALEIQAFEPNKPIFVEQKGSGLGSLHVPVALQKQLDDATGIYLNIPMEIRIKNLVERYGKLPKEKLKSAILKLAPRLGDGKTQMAIEALGKDDLPLCASLLLNYYDHTEVYSKKPINRLNFTDEKDIANQLFQRFQEQPA